MALLQVLQKEMDQLEELDTEILAISADSVEINSEVKEKYNLDFEILSDEDLEVIKEFRLVHEKVLAPVDHPVARPAEYLVDKEGHLVQAWFAKNVNKRTRAEEILKAVKKLEESQDGEE